MTHGRANLRFLRFLPPALAVAALGVTSSPTPAEACGGCFVSQTEQTVVTDHRMAFSLSTKQTVLWDQIRYSGDPREFAWVLPVHPGARLELSNDAWFAALDATTQPVIRGPSYYGGGYACALTGCGDSSEASSAPGPGQVQILSQTVVGPYETVTLRATDPQALRDWLRQHAFAIPAAIDPTIDAYVREGWDFIALRLRPLCNERSMQPVRVVTPGADPSLPLRMVAAGVGARVGITLYVISEGRYSPQNFPEIQLDDTKLVWKRAEGRSNYEELSQELMAQAAGRSWLVEYAGRPSTSTVSGAFNPGLAEGYYALCDRYRASRPRTPTSPGLTVTPPVPCAPADAAVPPDGAVDAGRDAQKSDAAPDAAPPDAGDDGGTDDAGTDDAGTEDAGVDAELPDAGPPDATPPGDASTSGDDAGTSGGGDAGPDAAPPDRPWGCEGYDDLDVALTGLHPNDVWVTRLRATLPVDALAVGDLRLEPSKTQVPVSNYHVADRYDDETGDTRRGGCASGQRPREAMGTWTVIGAAALALGAILRRRRRR